MAAPRNKRAGLYCLLLTALFVIAGSWAQCGADQAGSCPVHRRPHSRYEHAGMDMRGMNMPSDDGRGINSQQQAEAEAMHAMERATTTWKTPTCV